MIISGNITGSAAFYSAPRSEQHKKWRQELPPSKTDTEKSAQFRKIQLLKINNSSVSFLPVLYSHQNGNRQR